MAQIAVIGLGKFGLTITETLIKKGAEVIAIDKDKNKVEEVKDYVNNALCMDSTDEQALIGANINNVDAVVIGIGGNREESILTAAVLRKMGVGKIIAKVDSELHARILKMLGVQRTIFPEQYVGREIATLLVSQNIFSYMEISKEHTMAELKAPLFFQGKSLKDLNIRNKYHISIIAIKYSKPTVDEDGNNVIIEKTNVLPSAEDVLEEGDRILVVGKNSDVDKLIKKSEEQIKKMPKKSENNTKD